MKKRLIAIDGLDASGKMTQTELLKDLLEDMGVPYRYLSFPTYDDDYSSHVNMYLKGRFDCFQPVTYLDRSDMTVIRPLLFTPEKEVSHFVRASNIVPVPKNCPADGITKREDTKKFLSEAERKEKGIKHRIFNAFFNK